MNRLDPQKVLSVLNLPAAWAGRERYVIVLNGVDSLAAMLVVLEAWRKDQHRPRSLHFICSAAWWLRPDAWRELAQQQLPECSCTDWVNRLTGAWPIDVPGVQRTELDGHDVTLTWCLGAQARPNMLGVHIDDMLSVDAWESPDPGKQDRLIARRDDQRPLDAHPWSWAVRAPAQRHALVVGAGFAGMGVAHALARRGWRVTVLDQGWHQPGVNTHTAHLAAALTPVASKDDNARARLSRAGALCAHQRWKPLDDSVVSRCGALQLQRSSGRTKPLDEVVGALGFSRQWMDHVDADQASDLAGLSLSAGGIWYPFGCLVRPGPYLDALSRTPGLDVITFEVDRVSCYQGQWNVVSVQGQTISAPLLIMANSGAMPDVLLKSGLWPVHGRLSQMHALAGQITMIPKQWLGGGPRCIVGGDGYVLPEVDGWCVSGGTYLRGAAVANITEKGVQENLSRAVSLLGLKTELSVADPSKLPGWAGWRAVLPGRLPAIGPLEGSDGLWIVTGYASRGLTWSALAGELIAGFLASEPLLLESDILNEIRVF